MLVNLRKPREKLVLLLLLNLKEILNILYWVPSQGTMDFDEVISIQIIQWGFFEIDEKLSQRRELGLGK